MCFCLELVNSGLAFSVMTCNVSFKLKLHESDFVRVAMSNKTGCHANRLLGSINREFVARLPEVL